MEYRTLDLKVLEAKDLKNVNLFSKMDVYVVVTVSGDSRTAQKTPVDKDGGTSPKWNFPMKFTVDDALAQQNRIGLNFALRSDRALGDRDIGEVYVPMKELLDNAVDGKSDRVFSFQVRRPSGKPQGTLKFSSKFGDKFSAPAPAPKKVEEPVMVYPAMAPGVGSSSGYAYPAQGAYPHTAGAYPPPSAAYPYPPPSGYGNPSPQGGVYGHAPPMIYGYGYPPPIQQPQKKKNSKLGLGLGAGLLGGLLIGDMMGDIGEAAAYDAGFEDGMDF